MDARELDALGRRALATWDEWMNEPGFTEEWDRMVAEFELRHIAVRWFVDSEGRSVLAVEQHKDRADAWGAARRNDGSLKPLRAFLARRVDGEWEPEGVQE